MSGEKRPNLFQNTKSFLRRLQLKWYIFTHRSRRQPYVLYDEHKLRQRPRGMWPRVYSFSGMLMALTILSMIYPLRPDYSPQENRNLAQFPAYSLSALADGSYFSDLSTWFADTFPLRDRFLALEDRVERLYGIQTQKITGEVKQGDAIPDAPVIDEEEVDPAPAPVQQPVPEEEPQQEPAPQEQAEPQAQTEPEPQPQPQEQPKPEQQPEPQEQPEPEQQPEPQEQPEPEPQEQTQQEPESEEEDLAVPELDEDAVVEKLSAVLSIDNAAYEYYNFVLDYADMYTGAINRAAEQLEGISNVYSLIVPNSMGICVPADLQEQVNTSDQKKAIDYMYSSYSDLVHTVPAYHTLLKHYLEGEYLYFRTDHHWTALGAYRAYEQYCKAAGLTPTPLDHYIQHEYPGFLGTFYNSTKSKAMADTPDTVFAYESPSTNNIHITTKDISDWLYLIIGNVEKSSAGNKYGTFIGGDNPFSYVENPNITDGSAVMLIKESYGNAFAPFLIDNYQYVYIVDYRYVNQVDSRKLKEMCQDLGVRDVLFLNTISTTRAKSLIEQLDSFVG